MEDSERFAEWVAALKARHLSDLRVPEVTKALRALSSAYVERRREAVPRVMESAGKRAAFALFYAPLHFLATSLVVRALEAAVPPPRAILDIGCGTGAAGAAWATAAGRTPSVAGIARHPWAVEEARWTYRQLGLAGRARRGDVTRLPPLAPGTAAVAAYVLNELPDTVRAQVEDRLIEAAGRGARLLVIEPIARRGLALVGSDRIPRRGRRRTLRRVALRDRSPPSRSPAGQGRGPRPPHAHGTFALLRRHDWLSGP